MSDQIFDAFGDRMVPLDGVASAEPFPQNTSRLLTRFGVTLFWILALLIVSTRVYVGV